MAQRLLSIAKSPVVLLAVISMLSLGVRLAWLGAPCHSPCRSAADRVLVFDEVYYVNAARVIAGLHPPADEPYAAAPAGVDPNAEHPQLAKLVIAASIELFGDGPLAWRLGSVLLGSLAILAMFALVRAAGGGRWTALGASALMAADNLALVHGRIGTLDIYVLAAMIWGTALYLRGRPLLAGAAIGVGACIKEVAPYALIAIALFEGLQLVARRGEPRARARAALLRLGTCLGTAVGVFVALLAVLDRIASPYDASARKLLSGGPFGHVWHMLTYAAHQTSPHGPRGIASYPWQWLADYKPITYLNVNPAEPAPGLYHVHPAVHFLGMVNPLIMLAGLPALALVVAAAVRNRRGLSDVALLGLAWVAGTLVPFELLSLFFSRTSYLYYMLIVMPGFYVLIAELLERRRLDARLTLSWACMVLGATIVMYPLTPLP